MIAFFIEIDFLFLMDMIFVDKNYLTYLFFIFFMISCHNDNRLSIKTNNNDSLSKYLEKANDEQLSFESRHKYNSKALYIINSQQNDSMNRVNYFKVANRYFNMNAMEEYKRIVFVILKKAEEKTDSLSLGKAYNYLGDYYGNRFVSDSAFSYYRNAEKIYKNLKDNTNIAKTLLNQSVLQFNEKDFVGSEKSVFEALRYLKTSNDDVMQFEANNILGIIYSELSETDKALEYHQRALEIANKQNIYPEYQAVATSLNNLGYLYLKLNHYNKAIEYFKKGLAQKNIFTDKTSLYANLKDNLAYCEFRSAQLTTSPALFYEALKINDSINNIPGIISGKLNLSEYYAYKKDTIKAIALVNEAYQVAKKNKIATDVLKSLKQKSILEPNKKGIFSDEYIRINDSMQLGERKVRNKLSRIAFETDELAIEKTQLIEQRKTLIYITLGIILLGVLIFVIRFQAAKNRELKLVQEQQKANEEIYQLMLNQQNKIEEVRQSERNASHRNCTTAYSENYSAHA
ncbi:tetratricopeptide repeat protein [Flavobacterium sp. 3HN19-14]|uniref:tetratricopeptide repeat protein n=1 Tax=Flavobacterium sp. 3HN19-14 TaxID=3448133 RepID=UPI003EDF5EA1